MNKIPTPDDGLRYVFYKFKEVFEYLHLLEMFVFRDIRVRYKQSIMGFFWAVFMPVMVVLSGIVIKKAFSMLSGKPLELEAISSVMVKSLPWSFFLSSIRFATNSLVSNASLVGKIYFPRSIIPMASVIACGWDFLVATAVLSVLLAITKVGVSIYLLWLIPIFLGFVIMLFGLSFIFSAGNLFFRDVRYIVEIILTFAIFFTPVFYEADMFKNYKNFILINPIAPYLESIRQVVVLHRPPDLFWLSYSLCVSLFLFIFGFVMFVKLEPKFAERI